MSARALRAARLHDRPRAGSSEPRGAACRGRTSSRSGPFADASGRARARATARNRARPRQRARLRLDWRVVEPDASGIDKSTAAGHSTRAIPPARAWGQTARPSQHSRRPAEGVVHWRRTPSLKSQPCDALAAANPAAASHTVRSPRRPRPAARRAMNSAGSRSCHRNLGHLRVAVVASTGNSLCKP